MAGNESVGYVDSGKRGRMVVLALGAAISLFVLRAFEIIDPENLRSMFLMSLSYFLFTYIGLIWAFRFSVNKRSLLLIIPQSAFFTMTQMIFVMLFFFRDFARVYEIFLLFILLSVIFVATYISFLMANIFNVAAFKQIPLVQVAKTTSYILTILIIYFLTFAVLSMQLPLIYMIGVVAVSYLFTLTFHISHFTSTRKQKVRAVLLILISMLSMFFTTLFWSTRFELLALIPVSVAFVMLSFEMAETKRQEELKWFTILQYGSIVVVILALNIIFR